MAFIYYLCVSLPAILLAIAYYHVRSRSAAFVFTVSVRLLFARYLKSFVVNRIAIFPLIIDGLQVTTKGSRRHPETSISWTSVKVVFDYGGIWKNNSLSSNTASATTEAPKIVSGSTKFITITVEELTISSQNLKFMDVLNPSPRIFTFPTSPNEGMGAGDSAESWRGTILRRFLATPLLFFKFLATVCLQSLSKLFLIQVDKLTVDLILPSHESSINITALQCLLYASSGSELKKADNSTSNGVRRQTSLDGLGVLFVMDMTEGRLILTQSGEVAFDYSGYFYRLFVDVHVPSRHMSISFRSINSPIMPSAESNESCDVKNRLKSLGLRDTVDVRIQALLEFYSRFQSAEDDAIELKLAKGLTASGRMRTINLGVDLLKVCVTDCRTPNPKNVLVDNVFFGIRNFKVDGATGLRIGGDDWCGGIGIFSDLFNMQESNLHQKISANIDKELMISADRIEWVFDLAPVSPYGSQDGGRRRFSSDMNNRKSRSTREVAVFEGLKALKSMRVINEGDYTDIETLTGTLQSVQLENLSPCTLDWQLITQAVSESFPTGRFSHAKHSSLVVCVDNARFSMELEDLLEGSNSSSSSSSSSSRHSSSIQRNDSNGYRNDSRTGHVTAKACSREIDRVVSFWFTGLSGKKDTVANQSTSKYSAHSERLEVCTTLLATSLRAEYNIKVGSVEDHFARGMETSTAATGDSCSTHRGEAGTDRDSLSARDNKNYSIDSLHLNRTGHMCGTSTNTSNGTNNKVKVNIDTSLETEGSERVGVLYTFTPFDFSAQSVGPGKIQIETVKSNRLAIDLLFSIPLPTSATPKSVERAASNCCGGLHGMARSEFLRSTLDSTWKPTSGQSSGSDIICDLGDTLVYLSAAGALKLSLANQMVRTSIEGLTAAMSRIKSMPSRMLSRGVMRDDQSFSHTSLSDFRNSRIRPHREKDKEKEREKEKERDKTSDIAASNSLLTVRCSRLLISLLIAESTVLLNATPADYTSPIPSSPAPTPAPHPQVSPSSDSPQPGTSASSDLDLDLDNDLSDGKRAHTGQGQGQSKGQGQGGSRNDSQDLTLTMDYTVFEYQSSPLETRYSWDLGSAVVNDFSEKVFMTSSDFVYHTRRPPVGVPYTYSSSATDSPSPPLDRDEKVVFGQNHEREGDRIGVEIPGVRYTSVHMAELEIGMSPHMQLGLTIDHLFAQNEAYKIAKEVPVHRARANTSPSPPPTMDCVEDLGEQGKEREMSFTYNAYTDAFEFEDLDCPDVDGMDAPPDPYKYDTPVVPRTDQEKIIDEQNSRVPSVLVVSMGMYRYTLDAVHKNIHIPGFAVLECTNLKVKIDATKDEAAVCDEISTLDFGPENPPDPIPSTAGFKQSNASLGKSGKKARRVGEKKSEKRKKATNSMDRNCLQYKRSGGIVTVSQDRMVMRFVCQKEAYMDTTRWRMTGPIYVASAVTLDGAIPTQKEDIILADTAYLPCLLLNPVAHTEAYPRMASLHTHNDLFDTPEYVSMSPGLSPSPRRETSDSRGGFCYFDISSTDGSYGSALRPFDSPKRSHVASKLDTAGTRIPCRRTVCSASLVRSAAPQKIYWDAAASAATLDMWFEDSTKEFMDSFNVSLVSEEFTLLVDLYFIFVLYLYLAS